jgi:hypothetical protein
MGHYRREKTVETREPVSRRAPQTLKCGSPRHDQIPAPPSKDSLRALAWVMLASRRDVVGEPDIAADRGAFPRRCHIAVRRAGEVYALRISKPPRWPHATWSSPRRVARGVIWLT